MYSVVLYGHMIGMRRCDWSLTIGYAMKRCPIGQHHVSTYSLVGTSFVWQSNSFTFLQQLVHCIHEWQVNVTALYVAFAHSTIVCTFRFRPTSHVVTFIVSEFVLKIDDDFYYVIQFELLASWIDHNYLSLRTTFHAGEYLLERSFFISRM